MNVCSVPKPKLKLKRKPKTKDAKMSMENSVSPNDLSGAPLVEESFEHGVEGEEEEEGENKEKTCFDVLMRALNARKKQNRSNLTEKEIKENLLCALKNNKDYQNAANNTFVEISLDELEPEVVLKEFGNVIGMDILLFNEDGESSH